MRTSSRIALLAASVSMLAVLAPHLALADAVPYPPQVTPTQTAITTTTAETSGPTAAYWAARSARSGSGANLLFAIGGIVSLIGCLLITLLVEVPVVAIAARASRGAWKVGVLVNTLTNPVAVLAVLLATPVLIAQRSAIPLLFFVAAVEVGVVVAEWRLLRWALGLSSRRALATSVVANALSFGVGLLILASGSIW